MKQAGFDPQFVLRALREAGFLKTRIEKGKSRLKYRTPIAIQEFGTRISVYAVLPAILGDDDDEDEDEDPEMTSETGGTSGTDI